MNGVAIDNVHLWLRIEHGCHAIERVRKIEVVGVQPGHDAAAGVVPAFLDCSGLTGIRTLVPVRDRLAVFSKHLLRTGAAVGKVVLGR